MLHDSRSTVNFAPNGRDGLSDGMDQKLKCLVSRSGRSLGHGMFNTGVGINELVVDYVQFQDLASAG